MNSENREHISALVDGEVDEKDMHAIVDKMHSDQQLLKQWERYNLVSNALRKNLPDSINVNLCAAIQNRLEEIPYQPSVIKRNTRTSSSSFGKTAGYALAASLGAVGFLGIINSEQQIQPPSVSQHSSSLVPSISPLVKREVIAPQISPRVEAVQVQGGRWNVEHPSVESKLNDYLVNHEYSISSTMQRGIPPYVRIVGYEPSNAQGQR